MTDVLKEGLLTLSLLKDDQLTPIKERIDIGTTTDSAPIVLILKNVSQVLVKNISYIWPAEFEILNERPLPLKLIPTEDARINVKVDTHKSTSGSPLEIHGDYLVVSVK